MSNYSAQPMACITCGFYTMFRDANGNPECSKCDDVRYTASLKTPGSYSAPKVSGLSYKPRTRNIARNLMGKPIR